MPCRSLTRAAVTGLGGIAIVLGFAAGCATSGGGGSGGGGGGGGGGSEPGRSLSADFEPFITDTDESGAVQETVPPAGGLIQTPGGGSVGVPQGSAADVRITVQNVSLTPEAVSAFAGLDTESGVLVEPVTRIRVESADALPGYVVVRLPADDASARVAVAAYLDSETLTPAWTLIRGVYDPNTGTVSAAVGLGLLRPVSGSASDSTKQVAVAGQAVPTTGSEGYVSTVVGEQEFSTRYVFVATEPTGPLTVTAGDAPIPVRGSIGLQLAGIQTEPLEQTDVTSPFGPRVAPVGGASTNHRGVDYRAATGTAVRAAGPGTVTHVGCETDANGDSHDCTVGAGFYVAIDHGNGTSSRYFHLTAPPGGDGVCTDQGVCLDNTVAAGQTIALSDSTGNIGGPHLHFEVRENGTPVDPEDFFGDNVMTVTMAMALDFEIQDGTQQAIPVEVRPGEVPSMDQLVSYVNVFALDKVIAGNRKLQFVLMQPDGGFEILADVPLTIRPKLTALTPNQGFFNDPVVASGAGFDYKVPANNVIDMTDIGREPGTATPTRAQADSLEFTVPVGAVFGPAKVTVNSVDSEDEVEFSPFVRGHWWNDSDETDDPVTMQFDIGPNQTGCGVLSSGATSFSVAPGESHEATVRAGDSFTTTITYRYPDDPDEVTETMDFYCDGDDAGSPVEHRGVQADFDIYTGGGGGGGGFLPP